MERYIYGGVKPNDGDYIFDYRYNLPTDIIEISSPQLYVSSIRNHIYWFGYMFKDNVSSKQRTQFIHYIKGLSDKKISDLELTQFIELPLGELDKRIGMYDIDCFVYPVSGRSKLVAKMISVIGDYTSRDMKKASFELVKKAPTEIGFDWDLLEVDTADDLNKYNQMKKYAEEYIVPAIKELDYFSLAKNVKPKYRRYIQNYLDFSSPEELESFSKLKGSNILVVDDINTSGSTLNEILRILNKVNKDCNIFVYTLIGNFNE
ncbi:MAG: phosphoribosyltransferase domain-containing protein [Lachnospiraceae bacterium]|nr:phosphoribosyltransferase domain-containing protein [Lachnospiraceae bacterium]MCM1232838.1 phosphoribosyltransferase domain-containing protein [Ruminococcus flavefaciens]